MLTMGDSQRFPLNLTMLKGRMRLLSFCLLCMLGLLAMQVYWLTKVYTATQENFHKEIDLAFEISIKAEFDRRCDVIEGQVRDKLMDTSTFIIRAEKDKKANYFYVIADKDNSKDVSNGMSISSLNIPIIPGDTVNKRKIVNELAKMIRINEIEAHVIYYRTQQFGNYLDSLVEHNRFSAKRLKEIYNRELASRGIYIPYQLFYNREAKRLSERYYTKPHLIYGNKKQPPYIAAKFGSPIAYVTSSMAIGFGCSVLLVCCIAYCLTYLLKSLFREKKLADIKNDFISNITHEFKTPIATIAVAVEALTSFDVLQDEKKTQRYLGHAKTELNRLSGLVDQILTIALYQNENMVLQREMVDIDKILISTSLWQINTYFIT